VTATVATLPTAAAGLRRFGYRADPVTVLASALEAPGGISPLAAAAALGKPEAWVAQQLRNLPGGLVRIQTRCGCPRYRDAAAPAGDQRVPTQTVAAALAAAFVALSGPDDCDDRPLTLTEALWAAVGVTDPATTAGLDPWPRVDVYAAQDVIACLRRLPDGDKTTAAQLDDWARRVGHEPTQAAVLDAFDTCRYAAIDGAKTAAGARWDGARCA